MTTSVAVGLEAQKMIDYRLDTLDRLLISSGIPRSERVDIVQSVEDQIHELVDRRGQGEPTREDVVQVLSELDPPEAYVSNWFQLDSKEIPAMSAVPQVASQPSKHSGLGITSFVLALLSLLLLIIFPVGFALALTSYVCATICLARSRKNQNRMWMPIVAQCIFVLHGIFCLMVALMG